MKQTIMSKIRDTEAITQQVNDAEINFIEDRLRTIMSELGPNPTRVDMYTQKGMSEIGKLLSKRFGYTISLTDTTEGLFSTYVIPAKSNDALKNVNDDMIEIYEGLKQSETVNPDKFKKSNSDIDTMLSKSYEALADTLNYKSVKIDLENAKINGLPADFSVIIMVDLLSAINDLAMSTEEILACILHEVGHTFIYLEQLYRMTEGSSNLIDTIRDEYLKPKSSLRDVLEITYRKNTNLSPDKMSDTTLILEMVKSAITMGHEYGSKDAEHLSDVFATRFGYGIHLTTALVKVNKYFKNEVKGFVDNMFAISLTVLGILVYLIGLAIFLYIYSMPIIALLSGVVIYVFALISTVILGSDAAQIKINDPRSKYDSDSYDSNFDRTNRIRQQIIAILKSSSLSNSQIKVIVNQLDGVNTLMKSMKPTKSLADKVHGLFSKRNDRIDMKYLLEDLMNNDTYVSSARLKTI